MLKNKIVIYYLGFLIQRIGEILRWWGYNKMLSAKPTAIFFQDNVVRLSQARLDHLRSLNLDIAGKKVLEVGAGIGLLTHFFENLGCKVLSTDGRKENVKEMKKRYPKRFIRVLDLDIEKELSFLGKFDIVFCYGTLYHLSKPKQALKALSKISDMILLETCVTPGKHVAVHRVRESEAFDQSLEKIGCRPTRPWIMKNLKYWKYVYVTKYQPNNQEFETNWSIPYKIGNHRAVFIASNTPLVNKDLLTKLPQKQEYYLKK